MPQLHLYVSDATADRIRDKANALDLPVSRYLALLAEEACGGAWPPGYLDEIFGSCPDFVVPDEPPYEPIPPLDDPSGLGA